MIKNKHTRFPNEMIEDVCPLPGAGQVRPLPLLLPPHVHIEDSMVIHVPHGKLAKTIPIVCLLIMLLGLNFLPQPLQSNT